jgi:TRAP-type C4-dicarboxylate transport system permease small subunit
MTAITSKTFHHAPALNIPRGARVAAHAFAGFLRLLAHLFTVAPAARRSRGEEAGEVREMARRWQQSDPGFAADLYAAAARHESTPDGR